MDDVASTLVLVTDFWSESGGMNELAWELYRVTGEVKYTVLGSLFDHPKFLGDMASDEDVLEAGPAGICRHHFWHNRHFRALFLRVFGKLVGITGHNWA